MAAESATTETVEKSGTEESTVELKGNGEQNPPQDSEDPTPVGKRDSGEGQEEQEEDQQDVDDDQNVENPAYIPKTGRFYMHDDNRRGDVVQEHDDEDEDDRRNLKKSRADGDWKHDRFDEKFQRPKTKKQIVTKYGFDIRHKEGEENPESTEEESSDARAVASRPQKERRVVTSSRGKRGGAARRPMKQREREDTVDESEGNQKEEEEEEDVEEARPAQKRQVKQQQQQPQQEKPRKPKPTPAAVAPPSSEDNEEEEEEADDGNLRRGQRRSVPMRRGITSATSRLRGRVTHQMAPPRRSSGNPPRQSPRNGSDSRGRGPPQSSSTSTSRRDYSHRDDRNDDRFENHRRGVIRGASRGGGGVTRGGGYTRGGAVRGGIRGSNAPRYHHGSAVRRTDTSEQSEGYQRGGSGTDYSSPRPPAHQDRSYPSGQSSSFRGGSSSTSNHPHPSANVYPRSGGGNGNSYQNNNMDYGQSSRGGYHHGPQNHHHQHHHHQKRFVQGPPPPMVAVGVVAGPGVPPPQMTRGSTHGHGNSGSNQQNSGRIRQPTDVVYFDPQQQQGSRQLPPRSKKVIPIVDPNKADQK